MVEDEQSTADDDGRAEKNVANEFPVEHGLLGVSRWLSQHVGVDWLDAQALSRRSVHDDVDPQYLHRVEWTREVKDGRKGDQRQC